MRKFIGPTALILAVLLSACGEPSRSVQYFVAHPGEILPTLKECQVNPRAKNCNAASAAQQQLAQDKWIATPPKRGVW
jgi:hypothetical protein